MVELSRRGAAGVRDWLRSGATGRHDEPWRVVLALAVAVVAIGAALVGSKAGPAGLLVACVGGVVAALVMGSPLIALAMLVLASFTRLATQVGGLPAEPMVLILCAMVASVAFAAARGALRLHIGPVELAMVTYVAWNVGSMLLPHALPAIIPGTGEDISVYRFILTGTVLPFAAFVVARSVLHGADRVRRFLVFMVVPAAYSAVVSILQFTGPTALVFPRFIVTAPSYPERAVGVVNQPVVNGMIMVVGFVTALMLAQTPELRRGTRFLMLLAALLCLPGVYLTRTRAVWLAFGLAVIMCAVLARNGRRRGFVVTLVVMVAAIAADWSSFSSSDRDAGGVGSSNEVDDRLNTMATSFWGIEHEPLFGWGIARFAQVNAIYHQVWAPDLKFERGYAIASHENELGIATELGLIGLALWVAVVVPLVFLVLRALRRLPIDGMDGRPLALIAVTTLFIWFVCGATADLRYFDYANLITFALVGAAVGTTDRLRRTAAPPGAAARIPVGAMR